MKIRRPCLAIPAIAGIGLSIAPIARAGQVAGRSHGATGWTLPDGVGDRAGSGNADWIVHERPDGFRWQAIGG